jgi:dUTPase
MTADMEGQIRTIRDLAKKGVVVLDAPASVNPSDTDFITVCMMNLGKMPYTIDNGDAIAELVISTIHRPKIIFLVDQETINYERNNPYHSDGDSEE